VSGRRVAAPAVVALLAAAAALATPPAAASPRICTSADTLLFGQQAVGTSTLRSATVTNCGDASWAFTDVGVHPYTASAFHVVTTCSSGQTLMPGDSCAIGVRFEPLAPGQVSGGIWLHNTTSTPDQLVTFYARGVDVQAGTASLVFAPSTADFGAVAVGAQAGPLDVTLANAGSAPLVPSALVINGPAPYDFRGELAGAPNECAVGVAIAPRASCVLHLHFVPAQAGVRSANLVVDAPQLASVAIMPIVGRGASAPAPSADVVEFRHPPDGQYFLTADAAEAAFLDAGGLGPEWQRTGMRFAAWAANDASNPSALDVCRFFGVPGVGPNSHFLTADPAECAAVKRNALWIYEGIAFRALLPAGGQCPSGTDTIQRLWLPGADVAASRHRYVSDAASVAPMVAGGWVLEGPVLCAPR
jgi:hypothetical protein